MDKALKFIYCRPLNYSCCVTAVRKDYELYKIKNNIMGYVTVENFPRPTGKRKWLSSGTEATPRCHYWKREVGHNKFTSALSQINGYQHRDLNLTKPKTVWSEFEVIMDTALCQITKQQIYNCEASISVITTEGPPSKRESIIKDVLEVTFYSSAYLS